MHSANAAFFLCLSLATVASAQTFVLRATHIFDSATGKISTPGLVVVAEGRIQAVGGVVPAGADVIELGDATLMPGFIDAHTHLTSEFNPDYNGAMLKGLQMSHRRVGIPRHSFCILTTLVSDGYHSLAAGSTFLRYDSQSMFVSQMGYLKRCETIKCSLTQSLRFAPVKLGLAFLL
jgi:hypothetical protein